VTLHRFFLPPDAFAGETVTFPPETSRQISRVLRLRAGDRVIALDNSGTECVVRLDEGNWGTVEQRRENGAEPSCRITLYQGLLKGPKLELVLQKCTEIGVSCIVPVVTTRCVPGEPSAARQARFETIAREAAEQSGRGRIPQVLAPMALNDALDTATEDGPLVVLWEDEDGTLLRDLGDRLSSRTLGLLVGPEGGLTPDEVGAARERGAFIASLGPRILRAETAAMAGVAILLAQQGEFA
jgi:16S rRNA (uracil1498-N3)-methyltransferase